MTLIRWNPLRDVMAWHQVSEFTNMQCEIDRMFDRFRGGSVDDGTTSIWAPSVDIIERENDFHIKVELPGVKKEDVKITMKNNTLTVRGEKKLEQEKNGEKYHRIERSYGMFQRSFTLPTSVLSDKIEAEYDNGVLSISIPKAEEAKPRDIEVKVK
jgi:HSP20 family protein